GWKAREGGVPGLSSLPLRTTPVSLSRPGHALPSQHLPGATPMRITLLPAAGLLAVAAALTPVCPTARADEPKPPPGFTAILNGKDLTGWEGHTTMGERAKYPPETLTELRKKRTEAALEHWSAKEGVIVLDGKPSTGWIVDKDGKVMMDKKPMGLNLVTAKDYGNFELYVDWKIEKG